MMELIVDAECDYQESKKLSGGAIANAILVGLTAKTETILIKANSSMRSQSEE